MPEGVLGELFGDARRRAGLLDLTLSNPTSAGFDYPADELAHALADVGVARYSPHPLGLATAREALSRDWRSRGFTVTPEDLVLTASTSEAYSMLFKLLCDPGDEILVPEPSYPLFEVLARLDAVNPVSYRLEYDGAWYVDLDSLRSKRTPRTRAIVAVSPNNPTGSFLKRAELMALAKLGLPLISDEVFWPYAWRQDPAMVASALAAEDCPVFVLDGLSKRCGLPQMKLAWITLAGPTALRARSRVRLELINDSYLSASAPVQQALERLLGLGKRIERQIAERCRVNLGLVQEALLGSPVTPLFVEGGWSACLRLPGTQADEEWVLGLLRQHQVLVQPGWFYDLGPGSHVVVSLLPESAQFAEGVARLRAWVESPSHA